MRTDQFHARIKSSIESLSKIGAEIPMGRASHVAIAPVQDTFTVWEYLLRRLDSLSDQLQVIAIDKRKAQVIYVVKQAGARNPIDFKRDENLHEKAHCNTCTWDRVAANDRAHYASHANLDNTSQNEAQTADATPETAD